MLIFDIRTENDSKRCFFVVTVPVFFFRGADLDILKDLSGLDFGPFEVLIVEGILLYNFRSSPRHEEACRTARHDGAAKCCYRR